MNKSKLLTSGNSIMKTFIFSLIIALFLFVIFTIAVLILGLLPGESKIPLIVILSVEILLIIALFITLYRFLRSIDVITQKAGLFAQNELNISDVPFEKAHGLEVLAIAFNDMKSNLQSFIDLTKVNIIIISDAIDNVSRSMNYSFKGNEQIADSIGNVAEKSQEQAKLMSENMSRINEVKNGIENITNSIREVEKSVEKTVHATTVGVQHLEDYYQQVNIISGNLNNTSEYIKKLKSDITQIDQIGKFVIKISEQLKLLGLNASIEAAKAGESGKGFAVVAHEMNKLSSATKESIKQINTILKNIVNSSVFVSNSIDSCVKSHGDSKDTFISIKESFGIINNSATVLESDMKKVYNDVSLINSSTQEINQKSLLLHSLSGEISGKTRVIASVTQQSLTELEEINTYTSKLQTMLTRIERLVKKYHTSVIPVENESKRQLRISFISPLDNEFWYIIRQGAMYAIRELRGQNVVIDYIGIKEDVGAQMREKAREAIENGVDGILVPGFDPEFIEIIEVAHQKNIPVMIYNFDLQKESKSIAYCGPEFNATGAMAARYMARALGRKGEIATFSPGTNAVVDEFERETTAAEVKKFRG
ncbi:MAG: substrate-binding domain-containing protein, partial [Clostridiaceae bacterium]|nr:substrate-binding domain-containing protein [Clostridiaceae bacterium]